jgi:feruloyl esterase
MKRLILAAGVAMALGAPGLARAETACAELKATRLPHAEVTAATLETLGEAQACKLSVTSRPTADSDIRIEVWIPVGQAWNGKFVQMGNGGFAGLIPSGYLTGLAVQGYAAAGTDNGHQSPVGTSAVWARGHPEKLVDYGWRSLKETTEVAKALIAAQKAGGPTRSYFYGCSDGGREALMEAQRFPTDFDGIVAGAPANYMSLLFANGAAQQQALARPAPGWARASFRRGRPPRARSAAAGRTSRTPRAAASIRRRSNAARATTPRPASRRPSSPPRARSIRAARTRAPGASRCRA